MTAPALVLVTKGSAEQESNGAFHSLRKQLQIMRPDLQVNVAFLRHCPPTGPQVVSSLVHRGVNEVVFVPLSLTAAFSDPGVEELVNKVSAAHPNVAFAAARPLGPVSVLLDLLDAQLRQALRSQGAMQIDSLVLATSADVDARGISLLKRRARQWASRHNLICQLAINYSDGIGTAQAVSTLRSQGRRHIAVGSLWLSDDESWVAQKQSALRNGAIAVSRPFGVQKTLLELAIARYSYAAMSGFETEVSEAEIAL